MKTIIARFQELKKNVSEVEVDGEIVDVNNVETALRSVGVALRDEVTGQFRDLDDVFLELASIWDTLDRNTQRYIATIAAGSRQQSRFIAMMDNYERTVELVDIANESGGDSARQFAKTMDSLDAKINKIKANLEELIGNLAKNETVKGIADAINTVLEVVNIFSKQGPVAVGVFLAAAIKMIKTVSNNFLSGLRAASDGIDDLRSKISVPSVFKFRFIDSKTGEEVGSPSSWDGKVTKSTHVVNIVQQTENGQQSTSISFDKKGNPVKADITQKKSNQDLKQTAKSSGETSKNVKTMSTRTLGILQGVSSIASLFTTFISANNGTASLTGNVIGSTAGQILGGLAGPVGSAIGSAAGGIIGSILGPVIDNAINGEFSEANLKKLDEAAAESAENFNEISQKEGAIIDSLERYKELLQKQTNKTITVEESQELSQLSSELAKKNSALITSIDGQTKMINLSTSTINDEIAARRKSIDVAYIQANRDEYAKEDTNLRNEQRQRASQKSEEITEETGLGSGGVYRTFYQSGYDGEEVAGSALALQTVTLENVDSEIEKLQNYLTEIQNGTESMSDESVASFLGISDQQEYEKEIQKSINALEGWKNYLQENQAEIDALSKEYRDKLGSIYDSFAMAVDEDSFAYENKDFIKNSLTAALSPEELEQAASENQDEVNAFYEAQEEEYQKIVKEINKLGTEAQQAFNNAISMMSVGMSEEDIRKYLDNKGVSESIANIIFNDEELVNQAKQNFSNLPQELMDILNGLSFSGTEEEAGVRGAIINFEGSEKSIEDYNTAIKSIASTFGTTINDPRVQNFAKILKGEIDASASSIETFSSDVEQLRTKLASLNDLQDASIQGTLTAEDRDNLINSFGVSELNFEQTANGFKLIGTGINEIKNAQEEMARSDALQKYAANLDLLNQKMPYVITNNGRVYTTYKQFADALASGEYILNENSQTMVNLANDALAFADAVSASKNEVLLLNEACRNNEFSAFIDGLNSIKNLSSELQLAAGAMKELNDGGQISIDTALSLIAANENYVQALDVVNGTLVLNKSVLQDVTNARIQSVKKELELDNIRIQSEKQALQTLIAGEQAKIATIDSALNQQYITEQAYSTAIQSMKDQDSETQSQIEADLQKSLEETRNQGLQSEAEIGTESLSILSQRGQEEQKILQEMINNWKAYHAAMAGDESAQTNAIKNAKELTADLVDYDYESTYGEAYDELANAQLESQKLEEAARRRALEQMKLDFQEEIKLYQNQMGMLEKEYANNQKLMSLLNNVNFLTTGGKTSSKSSGSGATKKATKETKEYRLELEKLYNILSIIADAERELEEIQIQRNSLTSYDDLAKNDSAQLAMIEDLKTQYKELLRLQKQEQENIANQLRSTYSAYVQVKDGYLQVNHAAIATIRDQEFGDTLKELIDEFDEYSDAINDTISTLDDYREKQEEIIKTSRDYAITLKDQILDQVIDVHEKEIEKVKEKYEAIKDEDSKYLDSLKKNLDKQRQLRDQEDEQADLESKEKRLALLQRDTSGIYAAEIEELKREIAEQRQSMADSETDRLLEDLEAQYEAQHQAMDDEVEYLQESHQLKLETMTEYWAEVERIMEGGYSAILDYLKKHDEEFITGSKESQQAWLEEWEKTINEALAYRTNVNNGSYTNPKKEQPSTGSGSSSGSSSSGGTVSTPKTPSAGSQVKAKSGAKIYGSPTGGTALNPYFGAGPYTVIKTQGSRALVRWYKASSGLTGWFNISDLVGYSEGGLVQQTGPVMVHGTKNKPEAFLSSSDTKNISALRDALSSVVKNKNSLGNDSINQNSGDTYYEIHIEVESIADDYDVEKMMAAMKKEIVKDAKSRNVIAIKRSR